MSLFIKMLRTARKNFLSSQSRSIVRLVKKDKELSSFDTRDAPLQAVNPFNLPAPMNNAAGIDAHISFIFRFCLDHN